MAFFDARLGCASTLVNSETVASDPCAAANLMEAIKSTSPSSKTKVPFNWSANWSASSGAEHTDGRLVGGSVGGSVDNVAKRSASSEGNSSGFKESKFNDDSVAGP
eukprot:CAMPEP_0169155958 /NCGR_PEP_ID=MMETSP1015-20121227/53693_1 /TAXON_ID=342587 /ORGANISM="Karlodinium micrum, Strain CCMP2283" /LENGTH=105 /DNA_ID=CAMNT_0009226591 /DNA_START=117 /DNA_END=434 /DNA_ORIENTATION=+